MDGQTDRQINSKVETLFNSDFSAPLVQYEFVWDNPVEETFLQQKELLSDGILCQAAFWAD